MYTPPGTPLFTDKQVDFAAHWALVNRYCECVISDTPQDTGLHRVNVFTLVYRLVSHVCYNIPQIGDDHVYADTLAQQYVVLTHLLTDMIHRHVVQAVLPAISDDNMIASYTKQWETYHKKLKELDAIFEYASSRSPLAHDSVERVPPRLNVWFIGTDLWVRELLLVKRDVLSLLVVDFANRNRDDPTLDARGLRSFLYSLVQLGTLAGGPPQYYYSEIFETPYVQSVTAHYVRYGMKWITELEPEQFLAEVDTAVKAEIARIRAYVQYDTVTLVQRACIGALLNRNMAVLLRAANRWCTDSDYWPSLALFFQLVTSLDSTEDLGVELQEAVAQLGRDRIAALARDEQCDYVTLFRTMLDVCHQCAECICQVFNRDKAMSAALQRGARQFVNENAIFLVQGQSAQALAQYCDVSLRSPATDDTSAFATGMTSLYMLLDDREEFNTMYASLLADRLIQRRGGVDGSDFERESLVVSHLRNEETTSREATHRWRRMIADVMQSWGTPMPIDAPFPLSILMLTSGAWVSTVRNDRVPIPKCLAPSLKAFEKHYMENNAKRTVAWIASRSSGTIALYVSPKRVVNISLSQSQLYVVEALQSHYPVCRTEHLLGTLAGSDTTPDADIVYAVDALMRANVISAGSLTPAVVNERLVLGTPIELRWHSRLDTAPEHITVTNTAMWASPAAAASAVVPLSAQQPEGRRDAIQAAIVRLVKARERTYSALCRDVGLLLGRLYHIDDSMVRAEVVVMKERGYIDDVGGTLRYKP